MFAVGGVPMPQKTMMLAPATDKELNGHLKSVSACCPKPEVGATAQLSADRAPQVLDRSPQTKLWGWLHAALFPWDLARVPAAALVPTSSKRDPKHQVFGTVQCVMPFGGSWPRLRLRSPLSELSVRPILADRGRELGVGEPLVSVAPLYWIPRG